ncbi:Hcp family type VI secretion system effector [Variovorax sp. PBL-E5]|uniref:Hcp family type VI secretion system effector n=1 Tax=Variovorax sp. PBL-E5 TaxID=434014 RepID=UPI0013195343|nr:type VI secretion system tube protein Hcp [Variovorax sp. PBL-E5]VTU38880.1 type VI secretion system effector, Hcp1 family [Variovorax sp. PBL-E5]
MSSDFYAKVTKADGESKKDGHVNEIEVLSWSWGVSNATTAGVGGGAGKGKATPQDISFTHLYDKASPVLAGFCIKGTHIDELKLTARKSGDGQQDYLIVTLSGAFITSVAVGGSAGGDMVETVSCAFQKIKTEYKLQDKEGKVSAGPEFTWNLEDGKLT